MPRRLTRHLSKNEMKAKIETREKIVAVSIALASAIVVFLIGAPDRWLAAIFITVGTFGGVISYFRSRWSSKMFWTIMVGAFLIHLSIIWFVFEVLLRNQRDVGFLVCVPVVFIEAFLIYHAVLFLECKSESSTR